MTNPPPTPCPGCGALLPASAGPTHAYIGASPACWAQFSALFNGGEPPLAPAPLAALIGDAYAAQHPGTPSAQATQSVAVHLLTLYGVLVRGVAPQNALWVRRRALRTGARAKHGRFTWLTPPGARYAATIVDIIRAPTPAARAEQVAPYIHAVWERWSQPHGATIAVWYDAYVLPD